MNKRKSLFIILFLYLYKMNKTITFEDRIQAFALLGEDLKNGDHPLLRDAIALAWSENPWFTPEHILYALSSLGESLSKSNLHQWLKPYHHYFQKPHGGRTIGVVMAGNIPAVGFHDFLTVLMTGHNLSAKLSSNDRQLIPAMARILCQHDSRWNSFISFSDTILSGFDAIIATGNNNSSLHFEYYFSKYPHIIRKNRSSVAVLTGKETDIELQAMAADFMLYFGMGCRSISKLFTPIGYDFSRLIHTMQPFSDVIHHSKYRNNYDYYKSIYLVNNIPFHDSGFVMLRESQAISSPISVLHYEQYNSIDHVWEQIRRDKDLLQCVISKDSSGVPTIPPGKAHQPELWDYADGIDTMEFLLSDFLR